MYKYLSQCTSSLLPQPSLVLHSIFEIMAFTVPSSSHIQLSLFFLLLFLTTQTTSTTFTLINKCDYTIWPGILASAGSSPLSTTGFELPSLTSQSFQTSSTWSGRFWARTQCTTDPNTNQFHCSTGDCGSGTLECNGAGAIPPATLAEFTVGSESTQDFYDVSLVDGYNLPILVDVSGGSGNCGSTGCVSDLNKMCPDGLRVGKGDACKSACEAFKNDEFCCSGAFGTPDKCGPNVYSAVFKSACPKAYSYAYDDLTSTFTCLGAAEYRITFCPSMTSQKSASSSSSTTDTNQGTNYQPGSGSGLTTGNSPVVVTGGDEGGTGSWLSIFSSGADNSLLRRANYLSWRQLILIAALASLVSLHL